MSRNFILILLLITLFSGCRKRPHPWMEGSLPGDSRTSQTVPDNLVVDPASKSLRARWEIRGTKQPSAYNVYIVPKGREQGAEPFTPEPYLGDNNPDDSLIEFIANGLMNNVRYNVWVELLFPDGSKSTPSEKVEVVCTPRGEIVLRIRHKYEPDGFSFSQGRYVDARDTSNDLYFFSKDSLDFLCSPARLDGFLKDNAFAILPHKGSLKDIVDKTPTFSEVLATDRVIVKPGKWILIRLPDATHALVKVLSVSGRKNERKVKLFYTYSAVINEYFF